MLGSAQHRLWACPAYRETRMDLPPTHQHQGQTATRDKLKWERGLTHDPVEKYTPGGAHDGTIHVWVHPSAVGNSFGVKLFVDGSLMCQHGAQGGQMGWAVAQINEAIHELVCSALGVTPISPSVQCRTMRAELWALLQVIILYEPGATFITECAVVLSGTKTRLETNLGTLPRHWRGSPQRFGDKMQGTPKPSWTTQATPSRRATSGQTSWQKERVMIPSNPSCTTHTMQLSKQAEPPSTTLGTSSFERKE